VAQITPQFLFDLESNMRVISEREYERLVANLWWQNVGKVMPSGAKKERINWLLDTAMIERPNAAHGGGQAIFEDIVMQTTEYENQNAVAGLELKKEQLEDLDGNGVQLAAHWSRQMGAQAAYWPQRVITDAILANPVTYDGVAFFIPNSAGPGNLHPVNPFNLPAGEFANHLTGAAAGIYPGAVPVGGATTLDAAIDNIQSVLAYVASIAMPNGREPRMLKMAGILHPPALTARFQQITQAQFIAQAAASGGGSADVAAVIRNFGLGTPIEAPELGSAFGGSDSDYYILAEEITSNELGAFVYVDREPFSMLFHGPMTDAELARKRAFQWTTEGRNVVGAGHPYLMFKCSAT
jgi:hypothetical protein